MSHEIKEDDNFGEVQARGERAWHGLGTVLPEGLSCKKSFKDIGLDWETELLPLTATYSEDGKKKQFKVPSHAVHVRSDTKRPLAVVGANYQPISNLELADFADSLVQADHSVETETAGSLRNGRTIFACVRLPKDIEVTDEDILHQYVLIRNSHDGSSAFQVYPTSVRVVCANTLRWSERDAARGISLQHTGRVDDKIAHARLALGLISDETERFAAQVRLLAAKSVKRADVEEYFRTVYDATFGVVPVEAKDPNDDVSVGRFNRQLEKRDNQLAEWTANMDDAKNSMPGVRGTAWAMYNAVSQWHDHDRGRFGPVTESDGRVHSNLFGQSHSDKNKAFRLALQAI